MKLWEIPSGNLQGPPRFPGSRTSPGWARRVSQGAETAAEFGGVEFPFAKEAVSERVVVVARFSASRGPVRERKRDGLKPAATSSSCNPAHQKHNAVFLKGQLVGPFVKLAVRPVAPDKKRCLN